MALEPKMFALLSYLVERPGDLASREELLGAVWEGVAVTDNSLTRAVAQLRKAIGDDSRQPRFIQTVAARGYRFIAPVTGDTAPDAEVDALRPAPRARSRVVAAWALLIGLAVAGISVGLYGARGGAPPATARPAAAPPLDLAVVTQVTVAPGLDGFPAFSPDGATLAFSSNRGGRFELFVKSLAPGGEERQLTFDGQENVQPAWSPDGRFLAYHSMARGGIWVMPAPGGVARRLAASGAAPQWSPDGRTIAFQSVDISVTDGAAPVAPSVLNLVTFPRGDLRQLTWPARPLGGHGQPSWSHDGRRIAFIARANRVAAIWTLDVSDGTTTRLADCPLGCASPILSADGRWLYYITSDPARNLNRASLSADGRRLIGPPSAVPVPAAANLQSIAIEPREGRIAYSALSIKSTLEALRLPRNATTITPSPLPPREPVTNDTSRRNGGPLFSLDGKRLIFTSWRGGQGRQVWTSDADGRHARQLTIGDSDNTGFGWLPGEQEIAYRVRQSGTALWLRAVNLETGAIRDLVGGGAAPFRVDGVGVDAAPHLMRDGRHLLRAEYADSVGQVWVTDLQTRRDRSVVRESDPASFPIASPDGRWVAYQVYKADRMMLVVIGFDGRDKRVLTSSRDFVWTGDFAPDNLRIAVAYRARGIWNIGWLSRVEGQIHPLTDFTNAAAQVVGPAWSPDGDRIVYERTEIDGDIWLGTPSTPPIDALVSPARQLTSPDLPGWRRAGFARRRDRLDGIRPVGWE